MYYNLYMYVAVKCTFTYEGQLCFFKNGMQFPDRFKYIHCTSTCIVACKAEFWPRSITCMSPLTGQSSVFEWVTADGSPTPAGGKCTCAVCFTVLKSMSVCTL